MLLLIALRNSLREFKKINISLPPAPAVFCAGAGAGGAMPRPGPVPGVSRRCRGRTGGAHPRPWPGPCSPEPVVRNFEKLTIIRHQHLYHTIYTSKCPTSNSKYQTLQSQYSTYLGVGSAEVTFVMLRTVRFHSGCTQPLWLGAARRGLHPAVLAGCSPIRATPSHSTACHF